MAKQGLHDRYQMALEAYTTEVCGSACRISSQEEQGHGMLSVRKSVGKRSWPVAGDPWISLADLEQRRQVDNAHLGMQLRHLVRLWDFPRLLVENASPKNP